LGNLAKSLGVEMKEEIKNGSNEIIANHLADKVLA
jgi:anti-sigma28 factor (negative regulator of flagellin synthesis)